MEEGSPFSANIEALAIYLRFTHAISYRRLNQLFLHLYALQISEARWMPCCGGPSFRSNWGGDLFAAVRSVVGTAARRGNDAYQAVRAVLHGQSVLLPG
jgi:hypothetical protein